MASETESLEQFVSAHETFAKYKAVASQETAQSAYAMARQAQDQVKHYETRIRQLERFASHAVERLKTQDALLAEMKATVDKVREWAKAKGASLDQG